MKDRIKSFSNSKILTTIVIAFLMAIFSFGLFLSFKQVEREKQINSTPITAQAYSTSATKQLGINSFFNFVGSPYEKGAKFRASIKSIKFTSDYSLIPSELSAGDEISLTLGPATGDIVGYFKNADKSLTIYCQYIIGAPSSKSYSGFYWGVFQNFLALTSFDDNSGQFRVTSAVTNMESMFAGCYNMKSCIISNWDTSNVTTMVRMFSANEYYPSGSGLSGTGHSGSLTTLDLSCFNTQNVTLMYDMFYYMKSLTAVTVNPATFKTTKVTHFYGMFCQCTKLASLNIVFDFDSAQDTESMFEQCEVLSSISFGNPATNKLRYMYQMFRYCRSLQSIDLTGWNTTNITNMSYLFYSCNQLEEIKGFNDLNFNKVSDMQYMFTYCRNLYKMFDKVDGKDTFDITHILQNNNCSQLSLGHMIGGVFTTYTSSYYVKGLEYVNPKNPDGSYKRSSVSINGLFEGYNLTNILTHGLEKLDTHGVESFQSLFEGTNGYSSLGEILLLGYDVSSVKNMSLMFEQSTQDYNSLSNLNYFNALIMNIHATKSGNSYILDTSKKLSSPVVTNLRRMFTANVNLRSLYDQYLDCGVGYTEFQTQKVTNMSYMFAVTSLNNLNGLEQFMTDSLTDVSYMFCECRNIVDLTGFEKFNLSNGQTTSASSSSNSYDVNEYGNQTVNAEAMFAGCQKLESLQSDNVGDGKDYSAYQTKNIYNMKNMFAEQRAYAFGGWSTSGVTYLCKLQNLKGLKYFDTTSLYNADYMFAKNMYLKDLTGFEEFDLSNGNSVSASYMFAYCRCLESLGNNLDASGNQTSQTQLYQTASVTDMSYMFYYCEGQSGSFTMNGTKISFNSPGLKNLVGLNLFDTCLLNNAKYMFSRCALVDLTGFEDFDLTQQDDIDVSYMFYFCTKLKSLGNNLDASGNQTENTKPYLTSKIKSMVDMFSNCSSLEDLVGLNLFDTSSLNSVAYMFSYCSSLEDLTGFEGFDLSRSLYDYNAGAGHGEFCLFSGCSGLTSLESKNLGDGEKYNTAGFRSLTFMFEGCTGLITADLRLFDLKNVEWLQGAFRGCSNLISINASNIGEKGITGSATNFCTGCTKLKEFYCPMMLEKGNSSLYGIALPVTLYDMDNNGQAVTRVEYLTADPEYKYSGHRLAARIAIKVYMHWDYSVGTTFTGTKNPGGYYYFSYEKNNDGFVIDTSGLSMSKNISGIGAKTAQWSEWDDPEGTYKTNFNLPSGYSFVIEENGQGRLIVPAQGTSTDVTLSAKLMGPIQVDLNTNGGTLSDGARSSYALVPGNVYLGLPTAMKEGFEFKGWSLENDNVKVSGKDGEFAVNEGITRVGATPHTLYAIWALKTYEINYHFQDSVEFPAILPENFDTYKYFNAESTVSLPEITRYGYNFEGWYIGRYEIDDAMEVMNLVLDTDPTIQISGATLKQDVDVYAKWTLNDCTINYVLGDGGINSPLNPDSYNVESGVITLADPTRAGYDFSHWKSGGNSISVINPAVNLEDLSIEAVWTPRNDTAYKVLHYKENLEDSSYTLVETDNLTGTTGQTTVAQAKTYPHFTIKTTITDDVILGDGSTTIEVFYDRERYTITWVDGDGVNKQVDNNIKFGADFPAYVGTNPTKSATAQYSYTWTGGWQETLPLTVEENLAIHAEFAPTINKYTVYFYDEINLLGTSTVNYADTAVYPNSTPTKSVTGYTLTFAGWKGADGSADNLQNVVGDRNVYAVWTIVPNTNTAYTVEHYIENASGLYELNSTVTEYGTTDAQSNASVNIALAEHYNPTLNNKKIEPDGSTIVEIYYARKTYTISWNNWDNSLIKTTSVKYGVLPIYDGSTPTREADDANTYGWIGWTPTVVYTTQDATYTAMFSSTINQYTVSFYDGANLLGTSTVDYGLAAVYPYSTPTKILTGYTCTFGDWVTVEGGDTVDDLTNVVANRNVYAKWNTSPITVAITLHENYEGHVATREVQATFNHDVVLSPFERVGYELSSWNTSSSGDGSTYLSNFKSQLTENLDLFAIWQASSDTQYEVKYYLQNLADLTTYTCDEDLTRHQRGQTDAQATYEQISIEHFVFDSGESKTISADGSTVVKVYYNRESYTVDFEENGGTGTLTSLTGIYGQTFVIPNTSSSFYRDGYALSIWNKNSSGTEASYEIGNTYEFTEDLTLYAIWTPINYSITYVMNGGTNNGSNILTYTIESPLFTLLAPTKTGYDFVQWQDSTTHNVVTMIAGGEMGDKSLTAIWQKGQYQITLHANYEGSSSTSVANVEYDSQISTLSQVFNRTGYSFVAWNTEQNGSGKTYQNGDIYDIAGNSNLYAQWQANRYNLTLHRNINSLDSQTKVYENVAFDGAITVDTDFRNDGYSILEWNTSRDGLGTSYNSTFTYDYVGSLNLYAIWSANSDTEYKVEHYAQNVDGSYMVKTTQILSGVTGATATAVPLTSPALESYYVYDSSNAQAIPSGTILGNGNLVLKLYYNRLTYTISVVLNESGYGTLSQNSVQNVKYGTNVFVRANQLLVGNVEVVASPIASTQQYSYSFDSWSDVVSEVTENATVTANITRTLNKYKVTWNNYNGNLLKEELVEYGLTPSYVGLTPKKDAGIDYTYEFDGWTPTVSAVIDNVTYTAVFDSHIQNYAINFDTAGGIFVSGYTVPNSFDYGTETLLPTSAQVKKEGFDFVGWTRTNGLNDTTYVTSISDTDYGTKYFYAHWSVHTFSVYFEVENLAYGDIDVERFDNIVYDSYVYIGAFSTLNIGNRSVTPTVTNIPGYYISIDGWYVGAERVRSGMLLKDTTTFVIKFNSTVINYHISYYDINEEISMSFNPTSYNYESDTIVFGEPSKDGFEFVAWYEDRNLTTETEGIPQGSLGDKIFFAKWNALSYTVDFNKNADSAVIAVDSKTVVFYTYYGELPEPTRVGYTFAGWYSDTSLTNEVTDETIMLTPNDHSLYAKWTINKYKITVASNNESYGHVLTSELTIEHFKNITVEDNRIFVDGNEILTTIVTRPGYITELDSWLINGQEYDETYMVTGPSVITAKFIRTPIKVKVHFNVNSVDMNGKPLIGTPEIETEEKEYHFDGRLEGMPVPVLDGYIFMGWYKDRDYKQKVTSSDVISETSDITLYAMWRTEAEPLSIVNIAIIGGSVVGVGLISAVIYFIVKKKKNSTNFPESDDELSL